jgi:pyruvate-ferredoxin/flavodoxin oxidoreductase
MPAVTIDANEAVASVAHRLSEVVAIYPITPASAMGELADEWSTHGRKNLWGEVLASSRCSRSGSDRRCPWCAQAGSLATTFTASQGLLLMIPSMFKIAGELLPMVLHVAARTVATHALSIFCDHSDVMACRSTGFAFLCAGSVQEAQDLAAIAHAATLLSRVPILHFFDGFRTSHEIAKIEPLDDETLRSLISPEGIAAVRQRAPDPGSASLAWHGPESRHVLSSARGQSALLRRISDGTFADVRALCGADRATVSAL